METSYNWRAVLVSSESCSVMSNSLRKLFSRVQFFATWDSPGQNTGVGSRSLLQGIFPTQGLNEGLLPCRQILYQLSGKPNWGHEHLSCKGLPSTRTSKWKKKKKCKSCVPSSILESQYSKQILKASEEKNTLHNGSDILTSPSPPHRLAKLETNREISKLWRKIFCREDSVPIQMIMYKD